MESVSGNEQPLADAIASALADVAHLRLHRDGNAIVAQTAFGRGERVVLAGHIDTVPVNDNLPSRREDGLLFGCGSCDMKSGVAVQLRLAARLANAVRDVTYVFYDCEEVEAERNGLLRLSRHRPELLAGDFAVLLEPSGAVVEGGCQGTLRADITARGERAHSARSWLGSNAIHSAGGILDVLRSYEPRQPVVDGLSYHEGLNAVGIRGGVAGNVIPDECVVSVNFRFAPDRTPDNAAEHVRSLFADSRCVSPMSRGAPGPASLNQPPRRSSRPWAGSPERNSAGRMWPGSTRSASRLLITAPAIRSSPTPATSTCRWRRSRTASSGCWPG